MRVLEPALSFAISNLTNAKSAISTMNAMNAMMAAKNETIDAMRVTVR